MSTTWTVSVNTELIVSIFTTFLSTSQQKARRMGHRRILRHPQSPLSPKGRSEQHRSFYTKKSLPRNGRFRFEAFESRLRQRSGQRKRRISSGTSEKDKQQEKERTFGRERRLTGRSLSAPPAGSETVGEHGFASRRYRHQDEEYRNDRAGQAPD